MGHQVEHAGHGGAATHSQHHVTQLRDGAVRQTFFEILLGESDGSSQKQGDCADDGDHGLDGWEGGINRLQAGHKEHPGGHHGGGMDQGGDGGRALHGVGQPNMEGKLGRFGHRAHEHQQAEQNRHCG